MGCQTNILPDLPNSFCFAFHTGHQSLIVFILIHLCVRVCACACTFQNASLLNRQDPDLPACLERTVLVWIPLGFLWLCAPAHLSILFKKKAPRTPFSMMYICKQVEPIQSVITTRHNSIGTDK